MKTTAKLATLTARRVTLIALAAGLYGFANLPARAADEFYTFKSVLSSPNASWCIEVPGSEYQAGKHVVISECSGKTNQIFGYEAGGTLTVGGYCLDGLVAAANATPSAGDPVGLAECSGSDHQAWELRPFEKRSDVFTIANADDLCVTVEAATIGPGAPLVLAQCAELDTQGWLQGTTAAAEPEYYWYSGHRYCWYDTGWHGGGWYWCGENFHRGIGWGGPIGWHWWHHRGHRPHLRPHLRPHRPHLKPHRPQLRPHRPRLKPHRPQLRPHRPQLKQHRPLRSHRPQLKRHIKPHLKPHVRKHGLTRKPHVQIKRHAVPSDRRRKH